MASKLARRRFSPSTCSFLYRTTITQRLEVVMARKSWLTGAVLALGALPTGVFAQTPPITQLQYSADVGANIVGSGRFAARQNYVIDDTNGARVRVDVPGVPQIANLQDFHIDTSGDLLFALDVGVTLNGTYFNPADVIKYAGGAFTKAFDAAAAGVPLGVHCDGVARSGSGGGLLLSFDRTFTAGASTIRPADVITVAAGQFGAKVLDARALGIAARLNVDAIDSIATTTDLLVSFDSGGAIGAVSFADEDILQLHLADHTWSRRLTLSSFSDRWAAANLDGLGTAPNGDRLFNNGFE